VASYQKILVGTDGSETSFRAVDRAAEIARDAGAQLVVVCGYVAAEPQSELRLQSAPTDAMQDVLGHEAYQVMGSAPAEDTLRSAQERAAKAGVRDVEAVAVSGKPGDVILGVVADRRADLIVVGNRGLNTLAGRILGSVPQDVLRHAPVDVLVVHTTA
jgi:nucleotide-binding universal stress UspA family protein